MDINCLLCFRDFLPTLTAFPRMSVENNHVHCFAVEKTLYADRIEPCLKVALLPEKCFGSGMLIKLMHVRNIVFSFGVSQRNSCMYNVCPGVEQGQVF